MNLQEKNIQIRKMGIDIDLLTKDYNNDIAKSKRAYSFTDNWHGKKSVLLRIPVKAEKLKDLKEKMEKLILERDSMIKEIEANKLLEVAKEKLKAKEEEIKAAIKNPISVLEIE